MNGCSIYGPLMTIVIVGAASGVSPATTTFTYQGQLKQGGLPVSDICDFEFSLWDDQNVGVQQGLTVDASAVLVDRGLFSRQLDFGAGVFDGSDRWLEIAVRCPTATGVFTPLTPRERITAAPYAVQTRGLFVDDVGLVGVATTSPTSPLQLGMIGNWSPSVGNGWGDFSLNDGSVGLSFGVADAGAGTGDARLWTRGGTERLIFGNSTVGDILSLSQSGNVGIGTISPTQPLHVVGDTNDEAIRSDGTLFINKSITDPGTGLSVSRSSSIISFVRTEIDGNQIDAFHSGIIGNGSSNLILNGTSTGNVGIGTTTPSANLDISSDSTNLTTLNLHNTPAGQRFLLQIVGPDHASGNRMGNFEIWGTSSTANVNVYTATPDGFVGIGTTAPEVKLHVGGGTDTALGGGGYLVLGSTAGTNISIDDNEIMARNNGQTSTLFLNNNGGSVRVPLLEITGADVAEKFPVSEKAKPGTVMEIDPDHPGKLRIARDAYNHRVAGVVSGANGLVAGAILGNLPGCEDAPPIAMSGRVWVHCDATHGAIKPGDLLTTSDIAGYAMKVADHGRAQGAILGKAMTSLESGLGLVLVLVSLQ